MDFDFNDLSVREVPFKYNGKDYVMREASEAASVAYRNATLRAAKMEDGKVRGMDGLADGEPILVAACVFERYQAGNETRERPVLLAEVNRWPARVVKPLYEKIKEISELEDKETVDSLQKRITALEARRRELLAKTDAEKKAEADAPKGEPPSTTTTSS